MNHEYALEIVLNYAQAMVDDGSGGTILQEAVDTLRPKEGQADDANQQKDNTNEKA